MRGAGERRISTMKDANNFTAVQLKTKLQSLNLTTSGNKAELVLRLNQKDPTGQWTETVDAEDEVGKDNYQISSDDEEHPVGSGAGKGTGG